MSTEQRRQTLITVLETLLNGSSGVYDKSEEFGKKIVEEREVLAQHKATLTEVEIIMTISRIMDLVVSGKNGKDVALCDKITANLSGLNAISDNKLETFEQYRDFLKQELPVAVESAQKNAATRVLSPAERAARAPPRTLPGTYVLGFQLENVMIGAAIGAGVVVLVIFIAVIVVMKKRRHQKSSA